ncbi:MAG: arginine--tRNA ligase [Candidatus Bathyarchaeota archaeon]
MMWNVEELSQNPIGMVKHECRILLEKSIKKLFPDYILPKHFLTVPPTPKFGNFASSLCFEVSKVVGEEPNALSVRVVNEMRRLDFKFIEKVEPLNGYVNFYIATSKLFKLLVEVVDKVGLNYGLIKTHKPEKIIVEHTSANPSGPLHAGTARNTILGDALARILKARGHHVKVHFYINDVGKQVATTVYGYKAINQPEIKEDVDRFFGFIYAAVNCVITIKSLKEKLKIVKDEFEEKKIREKLDEYVSIAAELENIDKDVFYKIWDKVNEDANPDKAIEDIVKSYELKEEETVKLIKKVVDECIKSFKKTLSRVDVFFDSWDWESSLVWSGEVKDVVEKLRNTNFTFTSNGAMVFNVKDVAEKLGVKEKLFGESLLEIPNLVLVRSDGTSLYTTRDVAYHLRKFAFADKVINVIGVDQKLAQLQLKVALLALGIDKALDNLIHYAYELVRFPEYKMSRRRGRYVTFNELIDEAVSMAYREVSQRSQQLAEEEKKKIAEVVGIGAVKYAMLSVSASKTFNFTWSKVLNFETNAGPYIQYAYTRALNILKKVNFKPEKIVSEVLTNPLEKDLTIKLASFPEVFCEAADNLKPEVITEYLNNVADSFNLFYDKLPVLKAENEYLRDTRLKLVEIVEIVLKNGLNLLGIKTPEKM